MLAGCSERALAYHEWITHLALPIFGRRGTAGEWLAMDRRDEITVESVVLAAAKVAYKKRDAGDLTEDQRARVSLLVEDFLQACRLADR